MFPCVDRQRVRSSIGKLAASSVARACKTQNRGLCLPPFQSIRISISTGGGGPGSLASLAGSHSSGFEVVSKNLGGSPREDV